MGSCWDGWRSTEIDEFVGKTFTHVWIPTSEHEIFFKNETEMYHLGHEQECCEVVELELIEGDLQDLVDTPILVAERERVETQDKEWGDLYVTTFVKFRTMKGSVTLIWKGESNGYYGVDVEVTRKPQA